MFGEVVMVTVVIVPELETSLVTVIAAKVVSVSVRAAKVSTNTANL